MPRLRYNDFSVAHDGDHDDYVDDDNGNEHSRHRQKPNARAASTGYRAQQRSKEHNRGRKPKMADGQESFKCGHCKAFIGPTVSGGRHRNHCPLCLYSRHVDERQPGDRACHCRSLMRPIGTFNRRKGEQVILHRCLGCGVERYNRVAADDNLLACLRLPLVPPRTSETVIVTEDDEVAIA